jgi:hypothetical protein
MIRRMVGSSTLIIFIGVVVGFAFVIESFLLWRALTHYNQLTKNTSSKELMPILESIQKTLALHETKTSLLVTTVEQLSQAADTHLQHLVIKRFNPFHNTGGDQSFILGLLDAKKNGIVLTSLHSRENTRFYVKSVKEGIGDPHPLSEEEQQILKKG